MSAKNNPADQAMSVEISVEISVDRGPCKDSSGQKLMKHIEELNRQQQSMYPLINRLRHRIELQRRFVSRIGLPSD